MDDPADKAAERPKLLDRLTALLTREPEDREPRAARRSAGERRERHGVAPDDVEGRRDGR